MAAAVAFTQLPLIAERIAAVGLAGLLGWPFLLNGLVPRYFSAVDQDSRAELLALTGISQARLPVLGGWVADARMLVLLAQLMLARRPQTIVEFGSGISTIIAAHCIRRNGHGRLITHDHDARFAAATAERLKEHGLEAEVRAAPLCPHAAARNGWPGAWYDLVELPPTIDLLVVDGPPWFLHPLVRGNAASLFDRIPSGGMVLMDDARRPGERLIATRWRREHPDFDFNFVPTRKGVLLGLRR